MFHKIYGLSLEKVYLGLLLEKVYLIRSLVREGLFMFLVWKSLFRSLVRESFIFITFSFLMREISLLFTKQQKKRKKCHYTFPLFEEI